MIALTYVLEALGLVALVVGFAWWLHLETRP